MKRASWGILLAVWLAAGCIDDEPDVEVACTHTCQCGVALPRQQQECAEICVGIGEQFGFPPACLDCIQGSTCSQIRVGGCDELCNLDQEPDPEPDPTTNISEITGGTR